MVRTSLLSLARHLDYQMNNLPRVPPPPPPPPQNPRAKPNMTLVQGPRGVYLKIGVPLYEASIKCDWNAANAIINMYPQMQLVKYSITEFGDTALHVAASAKGPKHVEEFVTKLLALMTDDDLKLQNKNNNTALHLAAAAGNIKVVKIMVERKRELLTIAGPKEMMPLSVAALFVNEDVVKFMFNKSNKLSDADGWTSKNRGWLLLLCVENDMFDVALEILKTYPQLCGTERDGVQPVGAEHVSTEIIGEVLDVLARKPEAFRETKINIISKTINWVKHICSKMPTTQQPSQNENQEVGNTQPPSQNENPEVGNENGNTQPFPEMKSNIIRRTFNSVFAFIGLNAKKSKALLLLRFIWDDIAKRPKKKIDEILRGQPDSIEQDNETVSRRAIQVIELKKIIDDHLVKLNEEKTNVLTPASANIDQALQLQNIISECLVKLHSETHKIIKCNKPVSGYQAVELQNLIFKHIANMHHNVEKIMTTNGRVNPASQLRSFISDAITKMRKETKVIIRRPEKKTYSSQILFVAAECGNTNFIVELIRQYPDLIWKLNDSNQSIFHIAVKHRREGIYNLLYEIGSMKDLITLNNDQMDNNMLHFVGKIAKQKRLIDVSGVALQMQRELLWFQEVEAIIPPSYRERKNKDGLTPYELFTKEHKDLVTQGEKWMKSTASQCMIVAALIATIVFAAAFTVPGGYNQQSGMPVFLSKVTFKVFVVADAISLFTSSASILIFLSILTSRYAERDFLGSLPKKLMFGLLTLFLSIITMTIAFSISFFILYSKGLLWMPITISVFGVFPILIYLFLQRGLFFDIIQSTFGSRYLFKPQKRVLYYKNPNV